LGHPPEAVWNYTPRQTAAFLVIAAKRRRREMRELLQLHSLAARGDPKIVERLLKEERER
jgi:hypothetical protein